MTDTPTTHAPPGYSGREADYAKRLRRIEGQVRGIAKERLGHCVSGAAAAGGDDAERVLAAKIAEASAAIARLVRS